MIIRTLLALGSPAYWIDIEINLVEIWQVLPATFFDVIYKETTTSTLDTRTSRPSSPLGKHFNTDPLQSLATL